MLLNLVFVAFSALGLFWDVWGPLAIFVAWTELSLLYDTMGVTMKFYKVGTVYLTNGTEANKLAKTSGEAMETLVLRKNVAPKARLLAALNGEGRFIFEGGPEVPEKYTSKPGKSKSKGEDGPSAPPPSTSMSLDDIFG